MQSEDLVAHVRAHTHARGADTPTPTQPPCGWHRDRRALGVRTPGQAITEVMNTH